MRFTHGKLKPGAWNDYEQTYREIIAERTDMPGLLGSMLARDTDDADSGYTVSIWATMQDLQRYESSERSKSVQPRFMSFYAGEFTTRISELRLWNVSGAGMGGGWDGRLLGGSN
ncbi:antibiotic biosynthesis monooxygenase family protein [Phenylobacterium sp.]|uniref:antibiotic biosynthesis monooxygenase family protein n=1 Tax=Phenylobacterium sp. TaxID=1871053 RepID=UPI002F3F9EAB